jgi:hypothetical protein
MKRNVILAALLLLTLFTATSCKKEHTGPGGDYNTPATPPPAGLQGNWASGFANMIELHDVYTGEIIGPGWQSGKVFTFTADGKNAEFYYTAETELMQSATRAVGTIAFDEGSTAEEGSFTFYAGWAHYNGWGTTRVNRDATKAELANQLTGRYSYRMEGDWLRLQPGEPPVSPSASSFQPIN